MLPVLLVLRNYRVLCNRQMFHVKHLPLISETIVSLPDTKPAENEVEQVGPGIRPDDPI